MIPPSKLDIDAWIDIGDRRYMEDAICIDRHYGGDTGWVFCGVFDGHRGEEMAEYAASFMPAMMLGWLKRYGPRIAFRKVFRFIGEAKSYDPLIGCAALAFLIRPRDRMLYVANAGDCRLVLVNSDGKLKRITTDHNTKNEMECERIKLLGGRIEDGYVWRGRDGLEPTRGLGDRYFRSVGINPTPDFFEVGLPKGSTLIAASDGLWNALIDEEIAEAATGKTSADVLANLKAAAADSRAVGLLDNISVIVAKF